jgi:hypothetical protein
MRVWKVNVDQNQIIFKPDPRLDTKTEYHPSKEFKIPTYCFITNGIEEQPIYSIGDLT